MSSAHPRCRSGLARLDGHSIQTGTPSAITLSRTFDSALPLRELEEMAIGERIIAQG